MPASADGPYLLLEDLGWKGERAQPSYSSRNNNTVEFHRSLLAKYWETYEYMETGAEGGGEFVWLDQHIYALQDERLARRDCKDAYAQSDIRKGSVPPIFRLSWRA